MTQEERIAQLEAQVAALSEQISSPHGQARVTTAPVNYATSKYSLEEIDALLDYVASIKPAT